MEVAITAQGLLEGSLSVPGDKSISHRAVLLGSIASGQTHITGFLPGQDCLSTIRCVRQLGVEVEQLSDTELLVYGQGPEGLTEPLEWLDCGNSGTTMRLLLGIVAAQPFTSVLVGDESLSQRPMDRVAAPLRQMGLQVEGQGDHCLPPLHVTGAKPHPLVFQSRIASAQVKSCILLAGLFAEGITEYSAPAPSRDHTERMLRGFGANLSVRGNTVTVDGPARLVAAPVAVPGDFSSAAYFLAGAALVADSNVELTSVGLNPTRTGLLQVLREAGARIRLEGRELTGGEPVGTIRVRGGVDLEAMEIYGDLVPNAIDELPLLAVVATCAHGETRLRDAAELRVKETDRLATVASELTKLGARVRELPDGFDITGPTELVGAEVDSHGDHRLAMALAIAALKARGTTIIHNAECVEISYPGFFDDLRQLAPDAQIIKQGG